MPFSLLDPTLALAMPWKNGGGETLELAIAPTGGPTNPKSASCFQVEKPGICICGLTP